MKVKQLIEKLLNYDLEKEIVLQRASMLMEISERDITEDDKRVIITQ